MYQGAYYTTQDQLDFTDLMLELDDNSQLVMGRTEHQIMDMCAETDEKYQEMQMTRRGRIFATQLG